MSGTVNVPRFRVMLNGVALAGVTKVSLTLASLFQVGKFSFEKAFAPDDAYPASWWADTANKTMRVEIDLAVDGQTFVSVITGNVDSHRWDVLANTITAAGRDLAAAFIDTRTLGTYRNKTAGEIVAALAAGHAGLSAQVSDATAPLAGRKYDVDSDKSAGGDFSDAQNEWDLICRLGSQLGIVPYMAGSVLMFDTPPASPPVYPATFTRDANGPVSSVQGMTLERDLTVARDVIVTVQSWNSRKKSTFSATYKVTTKKASTDETLVPLHYYRRVPNLTQAQCQTLAYQVALDISTHERMAVIKAPSLVLLTPETVVQVSGTGTDYDMTYYPRLISYEIDSAGGATTNIQAKYTSGAFLYDQDTGQQVGETP
jgi:phage protein D